MTILSTRPDPAIPHTGNYYYPSGIPDSSDTSPVYYNVEYKDESYNSFWVIYTTDQANQLVKLVGYFAPYIPLMVSS